MRALSEQRGKFRSGCELSRVACATDAMILRRLLGRSPRLTCGITVELYSMHFLELSIRRGLIIASVYTCRSHAIAR